MILPRVVTETCSVLAAGDKGTSHAVELNSSFNTIRSGGLEIGVFLEVKEYHEINIFTVS